MGVSNCAEKWNFGGPNWRKVGQNAGAGKVSVEKKRKFWREHKSGKEKLDVNQVGRQRREWQRSFPSKRNGEMDGTQVRKTGM